MSIKSELIRAGRYDDIVKALNSIINNTVPAEVPVNVHFGDDGKCHSHIKTKPLLIEARKFLDDLQNDRVDSYTSSEDINNLWLYVNSESDMLLHNLGVHLCHGSIEEDEIERARIWITLENLIICLDDDIDRTSPWTVPAGWCKQ